MKNFTLGLALCFCSLLGIAQVIDPNFDPIFLEGAVGKRIEPGANNKLLVSGTFTHVGSHPARGFAQLLSNGDLDTTFQFDEQIIEAPKHFAAQVDGKVLIAGSFTNVEGDFLGNLMRLQPNGQLDTSFAAFADSSLTITNVAVLPNQKIFIAYNRCDIPNSIKCTLNAVQLFDRNGAPDPFFGTIEFTTNETTDLLTLADIGFQSDNALLVMGTQLQLDTLVQTAYRFDSLGQVDQSFNPDLKSIGYYDVRQFKVTQSREIGVLSGNNRRFTLLDSLGQVYFSEFRPSPITLIEPLVSDAFLLYGSTFTGIYQNGQIKFIEVPESGNRIIDWISHEEGIVAVGAFTRLENRFYAGVMSFNFKEEKIVYNNDFQGTLFETSTAGKLIRGPGDQ
ncbi:MAG: delta-60 repeat domain-containing protein, partial [Bacteroidota bacterium]